MVKRRLTTTGLQKVKAPESGRVELYDSEVPGLMIRVASSGVKTWAMYYWIRSRKKRLTIGRFPAVGPKEAREFARQAYVQVQRGQDPAVLKREAQERDDREEAETFKLVVEQFVRNYARGEKHASGVANAKPNLRTWAEVEYLLTNYAVSAWGRKSVHEISRRDVISLMDSIAAKTPYQANKVFAQVRKLFNWAVSKGIMEESPCVGVARPHKPAPRNRPLLDDEVKAFFRGCDALGYPFGACYRFLALTLQRLGEVSGMEWGELDLKHREWVIPAERAKNGKRHVVPLTDAALEILKSLPHSDEGKYVFSTTDGKRPISGHSKSKKSLDAVAKVENFKLKDLRETGATRLRERLGFTSDVVGQVLNHSPVGVTQRHYASEHSETDKREALEAWAAYLRKVC